jgi:arylsulfatase A-like enzyme
MVRVMTSKYFGAIHHIDWAVGKLLRELDTLGMAGNTLVLFTADHGNMLGERGRWFKDLQYEGSARVPLIWRGPNGSKENGGRLVTKPVDNTDLLPSILDAVGLPIPPGVQGRSFVPLARGTNTDWKRYSFSQLKSGMLLDGNWKLIDNSLDGTGTCELYDLRNDPREGRDLARDARQRERIAQYRRELASWRADRPAPVKITGMSTPDYAHISAEEREKTRAEAPELRGK